MALPLILIDSATGSDSAASGAGPSTALTGTAASTDGAGTTVTLDALTDLTGVATDGSHVIYLADSTAGNRNFGKITGKAGSGGATPTVTVASAFGVSLSGKSWAIGGKRASLSSTASYKLIENNSAAGDAKAGWIIEFQSGHTETRSNYVIRVAGDTTDGRFVIRGANGAATKPLISTTSTTLPGIRFESSSPRVDYVTLDNFELQNNSGDNGVEGIRPDGGFFNTLSRMKLDNASKLYRFTIRNRGRYTSILNNSLSCQNSGHAIRIEGGEGLYSYIAGNYIHDSSGVGIVLGDSNGGNNASVVVNNIITGNTYGISISPSGATQQLLIKSNTISGNTSDGVNSDLTTGLGGIDIVNNIFSSNGGYGVNFSSATSVQVKSLVIIESNTFYSNTSGKYNPSDVGSLNEVTGNPTFVGSGDYTPTNTALQAAYPASIP